MPKTPAYRQRPGYPNALVTLTDSTTGKRRDYWLGPADSPESREAYHRVVAEWEADGRRLTGVSGDPAPTAAALASAGPTVAELVRDYWAWAKTYYGATSASGVQMALRVLRRSHGETPARAFGPNALRIVRETMVRGDAGAESPRAPWCRKTVNERVGHIVRMFRWAASREMVPPSVHQGLQALAPLKRGRCAAKDHSPVRPAPSDLVDGARRRASRQVAALIELQLLTGARPGELLTLRPCDLDTAGQSGVWVYRPTEHKNAHRLKARSIYLGPRAQELIRPFLVGRRTNAFLFSPAEAEEERRARVHSRRRTPISCGNRPGSNRSLSPLHQPGERYTTASYRRAIERACDQAFPPPAHLQDPAGSAAWRTAHRFHPHQLRHNAGTAIRKEFGLEAAALVLGHASAQITDAVYAERDAGRVVEVVRKIG